MQFIEPDNSEPPPSGIPTPRRWMPRAASLAGLAALALFALAMLFIFRPDANRKTLDEIDALMAARDWPGAESLCRRRIAERTATSRPAALGLGPSAPSADLALRLGISLSMQDRFEEARRVFDQALAVRPKDIRLSLNRALLDTRTGRLDDALARLRKLAHDAPYAPNINYQIGRIYESKGLYDQALQAYRDELNISSSAAAWQRYLVLKKMKGATTTRPTTAPSEAELQDAR